VRFGEGLKITAKWYDENFQKKPNIFLGDLYE